MCASNACLTDTLTLLFMDRHITWRNSILDIILNKTCVLKKEKTVVPMCYILSELSALLTHLLAVMHGPYLHLLKPFFFLSTAHWILFVCISELRCSCIVKTLLCSSLILHGPYTEYLNPNVTPMAKDTHIQLFTPPKLPDISFVEASETFFQKCLDH